MCDVGNSEVHEYITRLQATVTEGKEYHMKPLIMETCANLFLRYMCSIRFDYEDVAFKHMVRNFDEIFWEINQGYAVDFLPWLSPFYQSHMQKLETWSGYVREFLMERVIDARVDKLNTQAEAEDDFTDALLRSLKKEENLTKNTIIFMLEDFLGGHSAVGELKRFLILRHVTSKYFPNQIKLKFI